jgi:hypothetical protein
MFLVVLIFISFIIKSFFVPIVFFLWVIIPVRLFFSLYRQWNNSNIFLSSNLFNCNLLFNLSSLLLSRNNDMLFFYLWLNMFLFKNSWLDILFLQSLANLL